MINPKTQRFHGGSYGRKGSFLPRGSHSDVFRASGGYQRDPGGGARNAITIAFRG
jgi:hypothetical protein